MFYRIFGGNGHGKTTYILNKLSFCVEQKKKAFFVVPEQIALRAEKEVISRLGPMSNLYVEVINFKRLCNRVFRTLGGLTSTHLDDGAKKMLMMRTLDKISPYLREYGESYDSGEFAGKALDMVNELKTYKVSPKKLEEVAERIADDDKTKATANKLYDISLIAEAYDARISEIPGAVCDIYEKLCAKLSSEPFFCGCDVFFDSFYGFTEREYEIISLVAEQADNTYVTFACRKDEQDIVFDRSIKSAKKCERIAEKAGCEIRDVELYTNTRHEKDSCLYRFEKEFCSKSLTETKNDLLKDGNVKTVLCKDIYEEAKFAAATILSLVHEGHAFSDFVICAKNVEDYKGILDTTFEKAAIPLGMDEPERLSESALYELVLSALEASKTFKNDAVIRYVKTGLSGLDEREEDLFETYVRTWDISPSLMKTDEDWTMNPDGYVDTAADEEILFVVNSARKKVNICLTSLCQNLKQSRTVKDIATAIYNLLQDIKRICQKEIFADGNGGISLELLYKCLDSFVSVAENESITLSEFVTLFKSCAKSYDTGRIPALSNQVQFSSVNLARCDGTKFVFLLGANSGIFPSPCRSASLISDDEKTVLRGQGLELSDTGKELVYDELFLAYQVITGAKLFAFVSYNACDVNGSVLFPSVIITAQKGICGCKTEHFDSDNVKDTFLGNKLLFEQLSYLPEGKDKRTLEKYFSSIDEYKHRLEELKKDHDQNEYLLPETAEKLYGKTMVTSYSRLEKMAGCPFSHFCAYTLGLKPEKKASLGPSEAGSVMHKILEDLVPLLCKENEDGNYPDEEQAKKLCHELLAKHLSRIARADMTKIPKRFVYLYNRLSKILHEIAVNIVRELKVTKFKPSDFELTIARDAEVKPTPISLGDGKTLYIVGQIDRVDVYQKDGVSYVRIVDYKTGKKTFKLKDIENGFNLQMLLYLSAITKGGQQKYGEKIVPVGVLYSNVVSSGISAMYGKDDVESLADYVEKPKSSGIFIDDERVLSLLDPTENSLYLPIGRKNGEIRNKDAVTSLEEMGHLLENAENSAKELASLMMSGLKSVTPFDGKKKGLDIDPCKYCDMFPVCMGKIRLEDGD